MKRPVLTDTGPLYALADRSDQFHDRARRELDRLQQSGYFIAVAYPTIAEAYTLVSRRLGTRYALNWLYQLESGSTLINPDPGDYQSGLQALARFPDHDLTLFDTVTAAVALRLKMSVWTFDRHFAILRAAVWT